MPGVSIGVAAARLGVSASTLRSRGTRYGIAPSLRSADGYRRDSAADLEILDQLQASMQGGHRAGRSRRLTLLLGRARALPSPSRHWCDAGPSGGRVLGVPGADAEARGLARAAGQLDLGAAEGVMVAALRERGRGTDLGRDDAAGPRRRGSSPQNRHRR